MSQICRILSLITLLASSVPAFASPSELDAVVRHCGPPGAESKETSPVNGQLERTLIYNKVLLLHFEPVAGGWAFTTAWNSHLPMTRNELEGRLPCFRSAMQEAAASGSATIDPTIASQSTTQPSNDATFGIPHFALIVLLFITLLVFILLPSARQRKLAREAKKPIEHTYRKPNMDEYIDCTPPPKPLNRDLD
jgi:hypothetical protein